MSQLSHCYKQWPCLCLTVDCNNNVSVGFIRFMLNKEHFVTTRVMRMIKVKAEISLVWAVSSPTKKFFSTTQTHEVRGLTLSSVNRLRSWSVPMLCRLALSWLITVLAMLILNFCRPMIFSSSVPRVISRYTLTTRFCTERTLWE